MSTTFASSRTTTQKHREGPMAKLHKKLAELESQLNQVFQLQPQTTPCHDLLSESIKRRFGFLKSLLSAEIESHPHKPQHLHHLDQRLGELEKAFHDWDSLKISPPPTMNHIDSSSSCSCTESCLNELEDGRSPDMGLMDSAGYEEQEPVLQETVENSSIAMVTKKVAEDMKVGRRVWFGKADGMILMLALIVVCVVMMARLCGFWYYEGEMETFPTPT